jgi:Ion channel
MARWLTAARNHPSAVLLGAQLAGVVLYPFLGESAGGRALISLFGLFVLVLAVWTMRTTPALSWVAILLGVPVAILTVLEALNPEAQSLVLWSSTLHAAFYFYTTYGLLRYMFNDRRVTTDELFATGATFTVVAWAFAYLYSAIQVIWPESFTAALEPQAPRTWIELLFLSFSNLTSAGLSDVLPVRPHARSVVMIEQVAGLMYIALVVARLVGLTLWRPASASHE